MKAGDPMALVRSRNTFRRSTAGGIAEVDSVPESARKVEVDGRTYYQYDSIFYRPIQEGKKTSYVIVVPPPPPTG